MWFPCHGQRAARDDPSDGNGYGVRPERPHQWPSPAAAAAAALRSQAHIQPANPDRNMSLIVGAWTDPTYPKGSRFRAYGLHEAWFLPCKWAKSYMSVRALALLQHAEAPRDCTRACTAGHPSLPY